MPEYHWPPTIPNAKKTKENKDVISIIQEGPAESDETDHKDPNEELQIGQIKHLQTQQSAFIKYNINRDGSGVTAVQVLPAPVCHDNASRPNDFVTK